MSYCLDGADLVDTLTYVNAPFPAPDALQEFSVQTSNYSAEFGENAGAVVNVVTKLGTNELHGDVYGFLRNEIFNVRNFFAAARDPLKRGQFGGTVGGPVIKNRTFFFAEYQGTRIRTITENNTAYVPTGANLAGDFSAYLTSVHPQLIKDPLTGQPFPNNQIPVTRFDPASLNVTKGLPQVNSPSGLVYYPKPDSENFDETMARVDHMISSADRVFVRYYWNLYELVPVLTDDYLTYTTGSHIPYQNTVLRETRPIQRTRTAYDR